MEKVTAPEEGAMLEVITPVISLVKKFMVTNQDQYDAGAALLLDIARKKKFVKEAFEPARTAAEEGKRAAEKTRKAIVEGEEKFTGPLEAGERTIKGVMSDWFSKEERIRIAKEAAIREQQEAEERARRKEEAKKLRADGQAAEAKKLMAAPIEIATPTVEGPEKVKGIVNVTRWKVKRIDIKKLCAAVASGEIPEIYVQANMVLLNKEVEDKKQFFKLAGVEAAPVADITVRA